MKSHQLRLVLLAVGVLLMLILPLLAANTYQVLILDNILIYVLLALGLNLAMGFCGQFNLAIGALYGVGAYTSALLTINLGLPFWLALPLAGLLTAAVGTLVGLPSLKVRSHYLAIVTIGLGATINLVLLNWTSLTGGALGLSGVPYPSLLGFEFDSETKYYYLLLAVTALMALLAVVIVRSRIGRAFIAIREDHVAAQSIGLHIGGYQLLAFQISSFYAGVAGSMYAHLIGYISPDSFTLAQTMFVLAISMVGGLGSLWGSLVGAGGLVIAEELLRDFGRLQLVIYGLLIVVTALFLPHGLASLGPHMRTWLGRARAGHAQQLGADAIPTASPQPVPITLEPGTEAVELAPTDMVLPTPRRAIAALRARIASEQAQLDVHTNGHSNGQRAIGHSLLEVDGLNKFFGGVKAVQDVTLAVKAGTIHGLIGPNGSGKSTIINVISGFYTPTSGAVQLNGRQVAGIPTYQLARLGIARTFQNLRLFKQMTVLDNVLTAMDRRATTSIWDVVLRPRRSLKEERRLRDHARELLDLLGLASYADWPATNLAYGLQRRVEIARALAIEPKLLLLDEPAAGLTPTELDGLADVLVHLREQGVTILLIEHHMKLVMAVCQQITVLDNGHKIAEGTPAMISRDPAVIEAYLGAEVADA
jgi:branched-chain amino acid transport system permease protein